MKSLEELNVIKAELEALNEKLSSLTEEELSQVAGGDYWDNGKMPFLRGSKISDSLPKAVNNASELDRGPILEK